MDSWISEWKDSKKIFLVSPHGEITYAKLAQDLEVYRKAIRTHFAPHQLVVLEASNNYEVCLRFISLLLEKHTVFISPSYQFNDPEYRSMLESETKSQYIYISLENSFDQRYEGSSTQNELITKEKPGFIVRTSGTSGNKFKFVYHDPERYIKKYKTITSQYVKKIDLLPRESIGGVESVLETLTHSSTLIGSYDKWTPDLIGQQAQVHGVDYLHASPSLLNLMLITGVFLKYDFSFLRQIVFGSEPVMLKTLQEIKKILPHIEFIHRYGMSETGIMATITDPNDPSTFKFNTAINAGKIVDGIMEVQSISQSVGYLNYPNREGSFFRTGDVFTELDTGFLRVIGRENDLINMAGRKFYPSEIEHLLIKVKGTELVMITAEKNELIGSIIIANIYIGESLDEADYRLELKNYCEAHVPYFMCPHKVIIHKGLPAMSARHKRSKPT